MKRLNLAIQKSGRLNKESISLLDKSGIKFENFKDQLMVECENFPLNIYFLRNSDIPRYLADGVVDLAIIGQNLIKESELEIFEIMELNFSKCRVSIAIPEKMDFNNIEDLNNLKIATSYPKTLSDFLDKKSHKSKVKDLLISVGLHPDDAIKFPHQFSGGQRQRIAIARALALNPEIIICDEAVSALDVSIQAQIIKLLLNLRNKFSLSYIFIAHDLPVVKDLADRVIVMKSGKIIEQGVVDDVFNFPREKYTKDLLKASPSIENLIS